MINNECCKFGNNSIAVGMNEFDCEIIISYIFL